MDTAKCNKCNYEWYSRVEHPRACPKCKQYLLEKIVTNDSSRAEARKIMRDLHPEINWKTHCVHHIDKNPMNNEMSNLRVMDKAEHTIFHLKKIPQRVKEKIIIHNNFKGKCFICSSYVPVNKGFVLKEGKYYVVYCDNCFKKYLMVMPVLQNEA